MSVTPPPSSRVGQYAEVDLGRVHTGAGGGGDDLLFKASRTQDGQPVAIIAREAASGVVSDPIELDRETLRTVRSLLADATDVLDQAAEV